MSTYTWPQTAGWLPHRFEMRIVPNVFVFTSQYAKTTQAVDLLGERWRIVMDLPPDVSQAIGNAREAFFDRLKGPLNAISIGHQRNKAPQGTLRGSPTLSAALAQLDNIANIQTTAGATLLAGDLIGLGASGQLVRVMADATANGSGVISIEFMPRARAAVASGTAVVWNYPSASFRLVSDGVPVSWNPGMVDGSSIELIEVV